MFRSPLRWVGALLAVVALVGVAACSDDDETTTTSTTSTTEADETTTTTAAATPEDAVAQAVRNTAVGGLREVPQSQYTVEGVVIIAFEGRRYALARVVSTPEATNGVGDSIAVLEELPAGWTVVDLGTTQVGCGITPPPVRQMLGLPDDCPPLDTTSTTAAPTGPTFPVPEVSDQEAFCNAYEDWVRLEIQRQAVASMGGAALDDANAARTEALEGVQEQLGTQPPAEVAEAIQFLLDRPIQPADADGVPGEVRDANRLLSIYAGPVCA